MITRLKRYITFLRLDTRAIFLDRLFLAVLAAKLIASAFFASSVMTQGFIPFLNFFALHPLTNPYNYFDAIGQADAFPYPPLMLAIFTPLRMLFTFLLPSDIMVATPLHLFLMRIPLLLADLLIYVILCKWLPTKERIVTFLYWASPVLFFITYVHGQVDVIPTAILFASLVFLFAHRDMLAFVLLGIGVGTKSHLLAVLPLYFIYVKIRDRHFWPALRLSAIAFSIFLLIIIPWLGSAGFVHSVFGTDEAAKVFLVNLPYLHDGLKIFLAPFAVLILFFNFVSYTKLNKDAFLLVLGLVFSAFVLFVPPMPGWFFWSIPFFVYYFAKFREIPRVSFWFMNIAYLVYFIISRDADFLSSFSVVAPKIATGENLFGLFTRLGFNMPLVMNLTFTILIAALVMNAAWIIRMGVRSNLVYKVKTRPTLIGIGGDSGAGKNTLARLLIDLFGSQNAINIEGDDAHRWERGDEHWKNITHLDPRGNNLHLDLHHTLTLRNGETILRTSYDHATGTFSTPRHLEPRNTLIYVGLHPFYLRTMRRHFDLKIFVEPDNQLRQFWKIQRDVHERGKNREEILAQIASRVEDAQKYILPQKQYADIVFCLQPIGELIEGALPKLQLCISFSNSLLVDPLLDQLHRHDTLHTDHQFEEDLDRQTLILHGTITPEHLNTIAYTLIPNLEELTTARPQWHANLDGLSQLLLLYIFSEMQKDEADNET